MREIKFRAWDKKDGVMVAFDHSDFAVVSERVRNYALGYDSENNYRRQDNIIYMQYTGLHDKNGVDIYEGDRFSYTTKQGVRKQRVAFKDGAFGCIVPITDLPDKFVPLSTYLHRHDVEVIGNIYENPELLDANK